MKRRMLKLKKSRPMTMIKAEHEYSTVLYTCEQRSRTNTLSNPTSALHTFQTIKQTDATN